MKKYFATITIIALFIFSFYKLAPHVRNKSSIYNDGVSYVSMVDNSYFYVYRFGKWQKEFIKGVNMGAAKPGSFPGELAITKEEYIRWFKYISDMNANTIRIYTILKPDFYEALYEYNQKSLTPIYLIHGVWVNEEDIAEFSDAYNPKIYDAFKNDIKSTIDIIHGNCVLPPKRGHASGVYAKDVSPYVIGWILGIEWDPYFILHTNEKNSQKRNFEGNYLYSNDTPPFETWFAEIGDYTISYEAEKYKMQRPLGFVNWQTTDLLSHPNEPSEKEDLVPISTNNIKVKDSYKAGIFASYHIYPYYPEYMMYQKEYAEFKDEKGNINPYKAYLKDLKKEHNVPVLVSEFGIPASRGLTHVNVLTGFNQGNVDENTQGEMNVSMLSDIYDEGYAGALVFTWQDEWFKRTWNTMDLDIPDRRAYWSNPQTSEQEFGLLSFEPGNAKSICYVDGDVSEWKKSKPLTMGKDISLYSMSDAKYLYLMMKIDNYNKKTDTIVVPFDTISGQGNSMMSKLKLDFKRPADFVLVINGEDDSRIMVDAYYDTFYYNYSNLKMVEKNKDYETKSSGIFNPVYLCLNRELYLPQDKITVPFSKYETGKLKHGNANPSHNDYNSLSDFYIKDNTIEIRIPWQLLNVMDPSTKMVMDDLYKDGIKPVKTEGFYIGCSLVRKDTPSGDCDMKLYSWEEWEIPEYHERLKPSYFILKEAFKKIGGKS